jgi:hypothetical protein
MVEAAGIWFHLTRRDASGHSLMRSGMSQKSGFLSSQTMPGNGRTRRA